MARCFLEAFGSEMVSVKEVKARLSFIFGINCNSLDYGAREQLVPGRIASQSKEVR